MNSLNFSPRIIRMGQAPSYCGMCERVFNRDIRPFVTEIAIGVQGIGFDRFELDEVLEEYKQRYGRPPKALKENDLCKSKKENRPRRAFINAMESGFVTKSSTKDAFATALERATGKKQKSS